jgi:hypothetical protein
MTPSIFFMCEEAAASLPYQHQKYRHGVGLMRISTELVV